MKLKKYISLLLSLLLILCLFTGCGGSAKYDTVAAAPAAAAPVEEAAYDMERGSGNSLTTGSEAGSTALPENRKWIITVHMSAETEDLDALSASLDERIKELNGYVEGQSVHNGSAYRGSRYRYASLTIRIPAADVDKFTEQVSGMANVVNKEKTLQDVTLSYVATESRITALETEEERLLELLSQAENMTDLLEIEGRLTEVRYELESYASRLRLYDNQIDYATIYLEITEVQEYTPVEEPTLWERISGGFVDSLKALGESIQDLLVWLIVSSPFLVVYGGFLTVIVILVRKLRRKKGERKAAKKAAKLAKETPDLPPEA